MTPSGNCGTAYNSNMSRKLFDVIVCNFIMQQATPHIRLRIVTFVLIVGRKVFSISYSDVMTMNMTADMECHLFVKHNLLQKSFIITNLMKPICSKCDSLGSIRRFDNV
ncbi:hypothetical protein NPIL_2791 [Nephila pilipes]|uniref:Uncharacterized protein n=1 Tax=Nephila pilipes TaxID=299642 RepID=A0A8X6TTF9_NEPPI|nr:hypothetical protein NPIL_2791 [Nephila pilipes]